jgi:DNA recombination protein RmuC
MEIIYIIAGVTIGGIAGWLIASFAIKSKTVSKEELNSANTSLNEARTALSVEQERVKQNSDSVAALESELNSKTKEAVHLQMSLATASAQLENANQNLGDHGEEIDSLKASIQKSTDEFNDANKQLAKLNANNQALKEKLATQQKEMEERAVKFNTEFENIASKILEEKTQKFTLKNKENLDAILKPLGENIEKFKAQVNDVYQKESNERFSLGKEVEKLVKLNKIVSEEANNLTNALKGSSKVQGDWGQMILENILEQSGLVKGREFFPQEFLKDEDGNYLINEHGKKMQPDVIIKYPDGREVIVDSKVSLTAYTKFAESDDFEMQEHALKAHINSLRRHIDDLSGKSYQDFAVTPDFVMMFVPIEPAYIFALQSEPDLWHYAYKKKVLLISPTNLIAALKLIENLWKRERQTQNAMVIADRGAALYDKFVGFVDSLSAVGVNIDKAKNSYDSALGQLKAGRGNLIGQAEKLRKLGLKTKKSLPSNLVTDALAEEEE